MLWHCALDDADTQRLASSLSQPLYVAYILPAEAEASRYPQLASQTAEVAS